MLSHTLIKITVLSVLLFPCQLYADLEQIDKSDALGKVIATINVQGLQQTKEFVVNRELLISRGDTLQSDVLEESLQRLRNLRLFHRIVDIYSIDKNNQLHVTLLLSETWTTIPIVKLTSGGDTTSLAIGAYDINLQGSYQEAGAQYEAWDGESGGVIWYRNPRFLNQRLRLGIDAWSVKRPRHLYEPDGVDQGGFVLYKRKYNLFLDKELFSGFTLGLGLEMNRDQFLEERMASLLNAEIASKLANKDVMSTTWFNSYVNIGRLNYKNQLIEGGLSKIKIGYAASTPDAVKNSYRVDWDTKYFWRFNNKTNIGIRFLLAKTNSEELQDLYYVGGFENVRGYVDGQLRAQSFWQSNIEYRQMIYKTGWMYLQGNIFVDMAQLLQPTSGFESNNRDIYSSIGIGLRIGSPKIYRLSGRLDIALETSHPVTSRVSFGVQQYF